MPAGRICVLVGPSGCGKTTTLRMVNRLIEPSSGRILIDGRDITSQDVSQLRRGIGYVIQQVGLFPHQTVAQNVATVPQLLGWTPSGVAPARTSCSISWGSNPHATATATRASSPGGERQRVGVARALAADPPVLLMDEPFGAVDPIVRERLQNELLRLQESLAKTILFVTHDIDEAVKMGDLVVVMQQGGRIAQAGAPADLLAQPASDYVARFVGADRGLKRLSLYRVADCRAASGTDRARGRCEPGRHRACRGMGGPLRPPGGRRTTGHWAGSTPRTCLPMGGSATPTRTRPRRCWTAARTLKDATSLLLDEEVRSGIVVDRAGRVLGLLTLDAVMEWMRDDRSREVPADIADAVARRGRGHA